jgi:hypothetical protein
MDEIKDLIKVKAYKFQFEEKVPIDFMEAQAE